MTRQTKQQRCPLPARQYSAGMEHSKQACRPLGCRGCHGRSVYPISTRRGRLCPALHYYWHPRIFRPSYGPGKWAAAAQLTTGIEIKLSSSCSAVGSRLCHFDPWRLIRTYRGFYVVLSEMHTYGIPTKSRWNDKNCCQKHKSAENYVIRNIFAICFHSEKKSSKSKLWHPIIIE